ncbi:MAG: DUF4097 family beta strand repeat-containing protein [Opitutaceae bacterium]|nr:DUF4097 family beta strand repeat-containing protein [Opitutaceae bacterium]
MHARLFPFSLLLACSLTVGPALRAADAPAAVKFSDPAKPGRLEIKLGHGDLRITAADTDEITVKSEAKAASKSARKDGLRVLSSSSSFVLSEKDNVATLDAVADGWKGGGSNFDVTVPRRTAIVVKNSWGGDITCTGTAGNLEINSMNGTIRLDDITGGVVASTMNGEIRASIRELREGCPLSFTSMNGEVVLRLPAETRANVRLRTQNGSVLTDFDETALVTKAENTPGTRTRDSRAWTTRPNTKVISADVHEAIREAVQTGASAAREAIAAVKESLEAAREGAEAARREAQRAREAEAQDATETPVAPKPPAAPVPPKMPALPTISGGKLVTGTLNGGGPEISVATMNGDVTLRKLEGK